MRIRQVGAIALATAALTALSACSSSSSDSDSPTAAAPVTITFWGTYGNGGNKAQTSVLENTILPAFHQAHPNITVKYVDIPYDSLLQKLTTSAAGGTLPDVVRADLGWVPKLASIGALAALDDEMDDFQQFADATYPGSLATNKWKDHYYGLPLDTNTRVLFSNQTALEEAGVTAPKSFDDLRAIAPTLKAKGISVFADGGLGAWNVLPWIWSAGGDLTDPGYTKASGYLDSPASVSAVQLLHDLYAEGAIPNLITGNSGATGTSDGLPKGKYANILDGPWMYDIWKGQYPTFAPGASAVPAGPGGSVSVVGGEDIVLTASSKKTEAALEFIRFTQSPEFQLPMAKTGQMPVVKAIGEQAAADLPYLAPFVAQLATAKPRPPVASFPQIDAALNKFVTAAVKGQQPVQEALTAAAKEIDALLAEG
jgi:multiple sugar transport system substrate-binding protein